MGHSRRHVMSGICPGTTACTRGRISPLGPHGSPAYLHIFNGILEPGKKRRDLAVFSVENDTALVVGTVEPHPEMRRWLWRRDTEFGTGFGGFDFGFLIVVGRARDADVLVGAADIGFARTNADACRRLRIYLLAVPRVKVDPNDFSVLNDVKDRLVLPVRSAGYPAVLGKRQ